ncbi:MAG: dCTP deaminase [Candidatus Blackburnbacteria bacterium]|nr:dCTP deaminase [Candidatus Blackburnbacteria bacterium]
MATLESLEQRLRELEQRIWCTTCELPFGAALSDRDIKRLVEVGRIRINPCPNIETGTKSDLGTCKVDLHLGDQALVVDATRLTHIDLSGPIPEEYFIRIDVRKLGQVLIHPGEVVVATTLERVTLPDDIIGRMEGKSSIARRGVSVQAAPLFDAGWDGHPILELHNVGTLSAVCRHGAAICAMSFTHLSSPTLQPYSGRDGARYGVQDTAQI